MPFVISLFVVFFATNSHAAPMGLAEVVRQGLAFSPAVQKAEFGATEASAVVRQTQGKLFPQISILTKAEFKRDPSRITSAALQNQTIEAYDSALKLTQPILSGGAATNGIAQKKVEEEIARQKLFNSRQSAVIELVKAYYTLAQAEKKLEVIQAQGVVMKAYADIVRRYEGIGRARKMDRLQSSVNLALNDAARADLERERLMASSDLKKLLGHPQSGPVLAVETQKAITKIEPLTFSKAMDASIANNPELRYTELEKQKVDYENGVARAEDLPTLKLVGAWGFKAPDRPNWFEGDSRYYSVGLELEIPLFSGLTSIAKRRAQGAKLQSVERDVSLKRLELRGKIEEALSSLDSEMGRLGSAQTAAAQANEALLLANSAYRQAIATPQDVLTAQKANNDAQNLLITVEFAYRTALLNLRGLMGIDLEKVYAR
jgi:outer membrane protein